MRVIGVLSGKGGVGKTTLVANLGATLINDFRKNVIIVDSNITTSHLGMHLGLYEDLGVTLREVMNKQKAINYAIYIHPQTGLRLLPAPLNAANFKLEYSKFKNVISQLKNYDIVLVDIAPGLGREALIATGVIGEGLVVTTPDLPSVTDALKTIDLLKRLKKDVLGVVINRMKGEKYGLTVDEIYSSVDCSVLSAIPEDNKIPLSISKGIPVVEMDASASSSIAIKNLAATIIGEQYQPKSFVYSLKKTLGLIKDYSAYQRIQHAEVRNEVEDVEKMKSEIAKEIKDKLKSAVKEKMKEKMRNE